MKLFNPDKYLELVGDIVGEPIDALIKRAHEYQQDPGSVDEWQIKDLREKLARYQQVNNTVSQTLQGMVTIFQLALALPREGVEIMAGLTPECFVHQEFQRVLKLLIAIQDASRNLEISL